MLEPHDDDQFQNPLRRASGQKMVALPVGAPFNTIKILHVLRIGHVFDCSPKLCNYYFLRHFLSLSQIPYHADMQTVASHSPFFVDSPAHCLISYTTGKGKVELARVTCPQNS